MYLVGNEVLKALSGVAVTIAKTKDVLDRKLASVGKTE